MESQLFEKTILGRFLHVVGYAAFVLGLAIALMLVLSSRDNLSRTLAEDIGKIWPASLVLAGFILFFAAKSSVLRRGTLLSFGSAKMTAAWSAVYVVAYGLMFVGCGLLLGAL